MSDSSGGIPDVAPTPPAEGGADLAELWRNIWPWDDLNAKGQPERWLHLGRDVLPVLAALVASGGPTPRLLKSSALGELLAAANISPSVQAVTLSAAGQPVVALPDTSPFRPNDVVNITSGMITGPVGTSTVALILKVDQGAITLQSNLNAKCDVGDVVTKMPVTTMFGQPLHVADSAGVPGGNLAIVQMPIAFDLQAGIALNGIVNLITAFVGQTPFGFYFQLTFDGGSISQLQFEDTNATERWTVRPSAVLQHTADLRGAQLGPVGTGFRIRNVAGANTAAASGGMVFAQV